MTVQIKAITSIDGNVCWCDEEDATAFAVYIGEPGEYRWIADFEVYEDARIWANGVADCHDTILDDGVETERNATQH